MQFRLLSDDLVLLYTAGSAPQVPAPVIRSFFGLLEAVEAARDLTDLAAMRSLGMTEADRGLVFNLGGGFELLAETYDDKGAGLSFSSPLQRT